MEVSDLGQNEISTKVSHLHQHISKSRGLGEKQKNESQNSLVRPYLPAPFEHQNQGNNYSHESIKF